MDWIRGGGSAVEARDQTPRNGGGDELRGPAEMWDAIMGPGVEELGVVMIGSGAVPGGDASEHPSSDPLRRCRCMATLNRTARRPTTDEQIAYSPVEKAKSRVG